MKTINEYKNRFYNLLETTIGDVKQLIMEQNFKDELIKQGVYFKTKSDSEVILKLYEIEGENFINKLNGMFVICIHDLKKKKILIYRDRFGIKPLYFYVFKNVDVNS